MSRPTPASTSSCARSTRGCWDGQTLPFVLRWGPRLMANGHVFKSLCFRVERVEEGVYDVAGAPQFAAAPASPRANGRWRSASPAGMTYKEIAREMDVASSTVSSHVYTIYDKVGVRVDSELVEWFGAPGRASVPQQG